MILLATALHPVKTRRDQTAFNTHIDSWATIRKTGLLQQFLGV
jgi:hypothetical protein